MTRSGHTRRKGALFYGLLALVVGTWGAVVYQTAVHLGGGEPAGVAGAGLLEGPAPPIPHRDADVRYRPDFRDPFAPPPGLLEARPPAGQTAAARLPEAPASDDAPPPLSLHGVVDRTAVVEDADALVYFVRVGDTIAGTRIVEIFPDAVMAQRGDTSFTLRLPPWAAGGVPLPTTSPREP